MASLVEWRKYVHMTYVSQCNAFLIQFPNIYLQCEASNSPQSPSGNGCITTKDPPMQVWSEGGMELRPYIPTRRTSIECDISPPNSWTVSIGDKKSIVLVQLICEQSIVFQRLTFKLDLANNY